MIFRQLFDRDTCTYTYLLADPHSRDAALIDPVLELIDRDVQLLQELELDLRLVLETHVHADHVTSAAGLKKRLGARIVSSSLAGNRCDIGVEHRQTVKVGKIQIEARHTPGHTDGCVTYVWLDGGMAFTGDALFVRGCGRTDFQGGDARLLYASVHEQILSLPASTLLYPGHDYKGRTVTTVAEERAYNPRLGGGRSADDFVGIMAGLNLAYPARIDVAVPANLRCGEA